MTISKIEVNEYQCLLCGYKWINRVNGKNGSIPERCAKCKKYGWNEGISGRPNPISPEESGLRRRVKGLPRVYWRYHLIREFYAIDPLSRNGQKLKKPTIEDCFDVKLTARFLTLDPRPTMPELRYVLYPPGLKLRLNSQNISRQYIPDPQRPGWIKYDDKERTRLVKSDAQKHQDAMRKIIEGREKSKEIQHQQ